MHSSRRMHATYTCTWLCPVVRWTKVRPGLGKCARPVPYVTARTPVLCSRRNPPLTFAARRLPPGAAPDAAGCTRAAVGLPDQTHSRAPGMPPRYRSQTRGHAAGVRGAESPPTPRRGRSCRSPTRPIHCLLRDAQRSRWLGARRPQRRPRSGRRSNSEGRTPARSVAH